MQRSDFNYELPEELIAQHPPAVRSESRLLTLDGTSGRLADARIRDLPNLLAPGDLMVVNDTRVIPARLYARKDTGGQVEILIERILAPDCATAQLRSSKPCRPGSRLTVGEVVLRVGARQDDGFHVLATADGTSLSEVLEACGKIPLPPYITRQAEDADQARYQTVFARAPGAVAAPTAGLHFDDALLATIAARGVARASVTLHVGAGTFQPVRVDELSAHRMHAEWVDVPAATVAAIAATRARGGRVVAIGTTAVRALESAAAAGELAAWQGDTRLFITPGYQFRVVDALLTNFHLPESTLLMLVSAFAGRDHVLAAYRHAVAARYRFFSYGDAMWLTPTKGSR